MKEGQKTRRNIPRPFSAVQSARWCGAQQKLYVQNETREAEAQTESTNDGNHTIPLKHSNNRSLMQSKDYKSFNRKVLGTVQTVGHQPVDEFHVPDYLITLERVTTEATSGLKTFALEYRPLTVWEDIKSGLDQLRNVWTKLKEAVNDLGLYVAMPGGTQSLYQFPSTESATDEASIIDGQEICATVLKRIIQNTYDAFQPYFNNALRLIAVAFREKEVVVHPSSIGGISIATRAIRLLGMLKEVENQLKSITDDRYKINLQGEYLRGRNLHMKELLDEMCRHLEKLQRNFFTSESLHVDGGESTTLRTMKTMAEVMRRCWKECTLLVRYLRKICPEHKDTAYEKFSHVLCRAGSLIAEMQDSQDLQSYLTECEPIPYEDQTVENLVQAQIWLLPCLEDLVKFSSYLSKKMRSRISPVSQMVLELKSVMYNVVMMATARASWLISWMVRSSKPNLLALKEQGSQSLLLVYNYNKSDLSLRCSASSPKEDMPLYGAFVYTTNTLRNGVIQVHGMMRKEAEVEETLSTASTSLTITDSQETNYFQHHRVQGMQDLVPKFSLKGFPLDLETALESDSFNFPPIKTTEESKEVTSTSTEDVQSTPTDLALEEGHLPYLSDDNNQLEDPVSVNSYQLYTQFGNPVSEEQNTRGKGPDLQVLIPPLLNNNDSASLVSPFATYNPGSEVYTPTRNNGSFGPPSPDDIETSSSHVDMGEVPSGSSLEELDSEKKVSMTELTGSEWIGRGAGGNVFKMSYVPRPVAVKIMNNDTRRTKDRFKKEVKIHSHLSNHPNIVQFVGTCSQSKDQDKGKSQNPMMVMELCDLGDLFKILCNARWVCEKRSLGQDISEYKTSRGYLLYSNWSLRLQVACDIAAGVEFMHSKGIVHRDLTSYNVVLTRGEGQLWIAKICDFERSREVPDCGVVPRSDTFANSPAWAAPEILDNRDYSTQADVYSLGVILWELATLQNPNEIEIDMFRREGAAFHQERRDILIHELSSACDLNIPELQKFTSIIKQCLHEQGSQRPTMSEVHHSLVEIKHSITEERN